MRGNQDVDELLNPSKRRSDYNIREDLNCLADIVSNKPGDPGPGYDVITRAERVITTLMNRVGTATSIAEAVAAEREACLDIVRDIRGNYEIPRADTQAWYECSEFIEDEIRSRP